MKIVKRVFLILLVIILPLTACRRDETSGAEAEKPSEASRSESPEVHVEPEPLTTWDDEKPDEEAEYDELAQVLSQGQTEEPISSEADSQPPELPGKAAPKGTEQEDSFLGIMLPPGAKADTGSHRPVPSVPAADTSAEKAAPSVSELSHYRQKIIPSRNQSIHFLSPENLSSYSSKTEIIGYLSGFSDIQKAEWLLPGTEQGGLIPAGNNEEFSFTIDTTGLSETIVVRVNATDSGGISISDILILTNDYKGPFIKIDSPQHGGVLTGNIRVSGRTANSENDRSVSEVMELSVNLPESFISIPAELDGRGRFSVELGADMLDSEAEDLVIEVKAADFNGNSTSEYVALLKTRADSALSLDSPAEGGKFQNGFTVSGNASGFDSILWDVPGTGLSGSYSPDNTGSFGAPVTLTGMGGSMLLRITAEKAGRKSIIHRRLYNSGNPPVLDITSPLEGDYYRDSMILTGIISPAGKEGGSSSGDAVEQIKTLYWGIPGTENVKNLVFFDDDGSFLLDIPTSTITGTLPLEITAEDYNRQYQQPYSAA